MLRGIFVLVISLVASANSVFAMDAAWDSDALQGELRSRFGCVWEKIGEESRCFVAGDVPRGTAVRVYAADDDREVAHLQVFAMLSGDRETDAAAIENARALVASMVSLMIPELADAGEWLASAYEGMSFYRAEAVWIEDARVMVQAVPVSGSGFDEGRYYEVTISRDKIVAGAPEWLPLVPP